MPIEVGQSPFCVELNYGESMIETEQRQSTRHRAKSDPLHYRSHIFPTEDVNLVIDKI